MGKLGKIVFPLVLAAGLLAALFVTVDVPIAAVADALARFDVLSLLAILLCTVAFVSLSAIKWQLVHNDAQNDCGQRLPWFTAMYFTSMGAALSIVAIPQVAVMITRSLGAKYSLGRPTRETATISTYEQLFDLVPLGALAVATIIALTFGLGETAWLGLAVAMLLLLCAVLVAAGSSLGTNIDALNALLPRFLSQRLAWMTLPEVRSLLRPHFTAQILAISSVRYGFVFARAWLIMSVVGLPIATTEFAQGFSLVRGIGLIGLTPGSLGFTEWSWTAVLALFGVSATLAATFAVILRILNVLSIAVLFLSFSVFYGSRRHRIGMTDSH